MKPRVDPGKIKELLLSGKPYREIAKELNYSMRTIKWWRRKLGLPPRKQEPVEIDVATVKSLLAQGFSCEEISKTLGIEYPTFAAKLRRLGTSCLREKLKTLLNAKLEEKIGEEGVITYDELYKSLSPQLREKVSIELLKEADPDLKVVWLKPCGYLLFHDWLPFIKLIREDMEMMGKNKEIIYNRLRRSGVPEEVLKTISTSSLP